MWRVSFLLLVGLLVAIPAMAEPTITSATPDVKPQAGSAQPEVPPVETVPSPPSQPSLLPAQVEGRLAILFATVRDNFWWAENSLASQAFDANTLLNRNQRLAFFAQPVEKTDPKFAGYEAAAQAADAYFALADKGGADKSGLPTILYLGALSHYSIGSNARALELFERLRKEYPNYKRDQYINDRSEPDPRYSVPVAASVAKLIFYLRLQNLPQNPPDAFAALQQVTNDALTALASQQEYSLWVASFSNKYNYRSFDESMFGSEPDQRRASALPRTLLLVQQAWETLLPKALGKAGAGELRQFLRTHSQPGSPLEKIALYHLQTIDGKIINQLFAEAQNLLNNKNFDGARAKYRQIMAEYEGTEAATRAENTLPAIKPLAVAYYRTEGEKAYQPTAPGQFMKPQDNAAQYFAKLYAETKDDVTLRDQADYAQLHLGLALATQGKASDAVAHLRQVLNHNPDSDQAAEAQFQLGFMLGSNASRKYDEAIKAMEKVWTQYPRSKQAADALWHAAFYQAEQKRYKEAVQYLQKVQAEYSEHPRAKHAAKWIKNFEQK